MERRVKVIYSAEIQGYKRAMEESAQANQKSKKAAEDAGKAADQAAQTIQKQGLAHHEAAKAAGLQYDNTGQLVTMNGKAVSSQQAATHGLQTFSAEAYTAGRAAVTAGEEAEAAAKAAAEAEKKAAAAVEKRREALERLGAVATVAGAATLAGVGMAVKAYADFDKQMSVVDSATHETAGNMQLLRQAAIDAGADTAFSAVDAGRGIEEMAKAGVATADILGGGLKGTLALAAAGALDVGDASEIAASAMVQFGLKGKDIPHIADLLAAGAGKAQGSVQDLGLALSYAGVPAAGLGISIEETTGTLAMFAKAGIVGEKAGTALRAMLVSMVKPADTTQKKMDELGISFSDANGEFIGLEGAGQVLQDRLGGLDEMTRNATLAQIFGNEALGAAQTLYKNGAAGVQEMTAAVNDYGYAADTAARMQDNLAGDLEKLGGSFDTVLIQSGSGANEVLRGMVQGLESVVDGLGKVPTPVLNAGVAVATLVGGAALVGGALITVIPKIRDTRKALDEIAPAGGRARTGLDRAAKGAEAVGAFATAGLILAKFAEADYMSKIDTGMGKVANSLAEVSTNGPGAGSALDQLFRDRDGGDLINTVTDLDSAIKRTFNRDGGQQFNDWGESLVNGMTGVKGSSQILGEQFERLDKGLADLVSGGKAGDAEKSFDQIRKAAEDQGVSLSQLTEKFPQYADALKAAEAAEKTASAEADNVKGSLEGAGSAAESAAASQEQIEKALDEVGLAASGAVSDIDKWTQTLFQAGLLSLSASDAAIQYQAAIDAVTASVTQNGTTLDINTEQGRANQSAYNGLAQSAFAAMTATAAETLATQGSSAAQAELQRNLGQSYKDLITAAGQFGITGDAADTMARKALGIPKEVPIDTWVNDKASSTLDGIKGKADGLDGRQVTMTITEIYNKRINEVTQRSLLPDLNGEASGNGRPGFAKGGRLPAFAGGGRLPTTGPGTEITDGFLGIDSVGIPRARLDGGEWIVNGMSSERYNRELAAINAGTFPKLPAFQNGGREYAAQSFGYAPASSSAGPAAFVGDLYLDSGEFLGKVRGIARQEAAGAVSAADAQAPRMRTGRRP
ncbi:phage tail tape measure protein [Pseudarthrobacter equi]|uniref:phage tail tape measure protein n=1 Tax=Pseudarthrobacter equi TaxID=728066 RepID=UPI0021C1E39B|nr:phage tail tape measure protein [Pseudarthrobacter equi]MCT9624281.1 phage tail tape measure protein [Pseudarthrobacter equi]